MILKLIFGVFFVTLISAAPDADRITSLPGTNFTVGFNHYSGYLNASETRFFHYWFVEAQSNPDISPVILWLNGGPGCSSMAGMIEELGPFHVSDNGNTAYLNPYTWNKFANIIFLDSPAGVGFSYDSTGNLTTNDDNVAQNNHDALVYFFTYKFPEYKNNDFYIAGESYGGVYIPTLAVKVAADKTNFPHFKGVAISNGLYDIPLNYNTRVPLFYYHGLIRQNLYDQVINNCCNGTDYGCDYYTQWSGSNGTCSQLIDLELSQRHDLDIYNLYSTCYLDSGSGSKRNFIDRFLREKVGPTLKRSEKVKDNTLPLCAQVNNTVIYLNRADVRTALHIPQNLPAWVSCSDPVGEHYQITHYNVYPEFQSLISSGIRILTWNGDVDTVCSFVLNKQFIHKLGLTVLGGNDSQEWFYHGETPNVGGFVTRFTNNVDFLTVRGSGHFIPQDKPREALQIIYNYIHQRDYSLPCPV